MPNNELLQSLTVLLDQKFAEQEARFDQKFAEQEIRFDQKFAGQDARFDQKFAEQDARFDQKFAEQDFRLKDFLDERFEANNQYLLNKIKSISSQKGIRNNIQPVQIKGK